MSQGRLLRRSNVSKIRCGGGEMLLRHASLSTCALKRRSRSATISAIFSGVIVGERQDPRTRPDAPSACPSRRRSSRCPRDRGRPTTCAASASRTGADRRYRSCAVANPAAPRTKLKAASVSERALFRSMTSSPNRARRRPEPKARAALTTAARSHRTAARSTTKPDSTCGPAREPRRTGEAPIMGGVAMRRLLLAAACLAATTGVSAAIPAEVDDRHRHAGRHHGREPRDPGLQRNSVRGAARRRESLAPPQPVAKWSGVRPATEYAARCTQGGPGGPNAAAAPPTSEDCLYLNVWTTADSANDRRPVMVWLYGGGFFGGAGSEPRYAGDGLARKGAVVVTLNYRLGALGFFAHPELSAESQPKVSGNYGMLDAIAALQWVQRNIAAFGGDPEQRHGVRRIGRREPHRRARRIAARRRDCSTARSRRAAASWGSAWRARARSRAPRKPARRRWPMPASPRSPTRARNRRPRCSPPFAAAVSSSTAI